VDFTFSDEQDELRATARRFLADRSPASHVRQMIEDEAGITPELWSRLVEMGWPAILVPEAQGGLGLGLVDMIVVLEEMGRVPFPGPFLSSSVFATLAVARLGIGELAGDLASGVRRGTIALEEYGHGDVVDRITTRAVRKGSRWQLTGTKPIVFDGHTADWVLIAARIEAGLGTFLLERPEGDLVPTTDLCRKVARLDLAATVAEPVGPGGDQTLMWRRIADDCTVAVCAELIGSTEQALDLAVAYAKEREQFGRPIATFQAIKHKAAEMLHRLTLARVGTYYAAWASDADDPERATAAAMAKADAGEAAVEVTGESIQIHGAVGFTWDCDAHLHYRRAKATDVLLGDRATHLARVAERVIHPDRIHPDRTVHSI